MNAFRVRVRVRVTADVATARPPAPNPASRGPRRAGQMSGVAAPGRFRSERAGAALARFSEAGPAGASATRPRRAPSGPPPTSPRLPFPLRATVFRVTLNAFTRAVNAFRVRVRVRVRGLLTRSERRSPGGGERVYGHGLGLGLRRLHRSPSRPESGVARAPPRRPNVGSRRAGSVSVRAGRGGSRTLFRGGAGGGKRNTATAGPVATAADFGRPAPRDRPREFFLTLNAFTRAVPRVRSRRAGSVSAIAGRGGSRTLFRGPGRRGQAFTATAGPAVTAADLAPAPVPAPRRFALTLNAFTRAVNAFRSRRPGRFRSERGGAALARFSRRGRLGKRHGGPHGRRAGPAAPPPNVGSRRAGSVSVRAGRAALARFSGRAGGGKRNTATAGPPKTWPPLALPPPNPSRPPPTSPRLPFPLRATVALPPRIGVARSPAPAKSREGPAGSV